MAAPRDRLKNYLRAMVGQCLASGRTQDLADLAILNFLVGNYDEAITGATGDMEDALRQVCKDDTKNPALERHRNFLLATRGAIQENIIKETWNDKSAKEIVTDYMQRRTQYQNANRKAMIVFVNELARALVKYRKDEIVKLLIEFR